jgi:predicted CopG family antitoxin
LQRQYPILEGGKTTQIWVEARVVDRLTAMRQPGESYSDVIMRLVELETNGRLRK